MSRNYQKKWDQNLSGELNFWRCFLIDEKYEKDRTLRLHLPYLGIPDDLIKQTPKGTTISILDVGSGPLTTIANFHPDYPINLCLCDPLADEYNHLLVEVGMPERAKIIKAIGETLLDVFSENSFDIVHCGNALDHAHNPLLCIKNMLKICKPGGWVYIISYENEGERQHYDGLHQWNFTLIDNKVKLWNQYENLFIHKYLNDVMQFIVKSLHFDTLPMFELKIRKRIA